MIITIQIKNNINTIQALQSYLLVMKWCYRVTRSHYTRLTSIGMATGWYLGDLTIYWKYGISLAWIENLSQCESSSHLMAIQSMLSPSIRMVPTFCAAPLTIRRESMTRMEEKFRWPSEVICTFKTWTTQRAMSQLLLMGDGIHERRRTSWQLLLMALSESGTWSLRLQVSTCNSCTPT